MGCTGGDIKIDADDVDINGQMHANGTGNAGLGGNIDIDGNSVDVTKELTVNGLAVSSDGGTIDIKGSTVKTTQALRANGKGSGGNRGQILVTGTTTSLSGFAVELSTVQSSAKNDSTGTSDVEIRANAHIRINGVLDLDANQGGGRGGRLKITSVGVGTADCAQRVELRNDVRSRGQGTSGLGGTIVIEGSKIRMSTVASSEITANGNNQAGGDGGTIELRAADPEKTDFVGGGEGLKYPGRRITGHFGNDPNDVAEFNDITATPSPPGTIKTTDNRFGGSYDPVPQATALTYHPCN